MHRPGTLATALLTTAMVLYWLAMPAASGYEKYNEGCDNCHGEFYGSGPYESPKGNTWEKSLHQVHRSDFYMGTSCDHCHWNGPGKYTNFSHGVAGQEGFGCAGCHGELIAGVPKSWGLRKHHAGAGVQVCKACHIDGDPTPENVLPPNYGFYTEASSTCNVGGVGEDFSGDGQGLDNDGDGLYDELDPDCAPCEDLDQDGWFEAACQLDPDLGGGDCNDLNPEIYPGAVESCNAADDNCDGAIDEGTDPMCADQVPCTLNTCTAGQCSSQLQHELCADALECTVDLCTEQGCTNAPVDSSCDDGVDCTVDLCNDAGCVNQMDDTLCDDGVECTPDICSETGCVFEPDHDQCDSGDGPCSQGYCIAGQGCVTALTEDGMPCSDGDPICTEDDECSAGACIGVPVCECSFDEECALLDSDLCNGGKLCQTVEGVKVCVDEPGSAVDCSGLPEVPCMTAHCAPHTGTCEYVAHDDGTSCQLTSPCIVEAGCQAGICQPTLFADCNDENPCTDDSCQQDSGCKNQPNVASCPGGECVEGQCLAAPAPEEPSLVEHHEPDVATIAELVLGADTAPMDSTQPVVDVGPSCTNGECGDSSSSCAVGGTGVPSVALWVLLLGLMALMALLRRRSTNP